MFYIFDKKGKFVSSCDQEPCLEDLSLRQEVCYETHYVFKNPVLKNGRITESIVVQQPMPDIISKKSFCLALNSNKKNGVSLYIKLKELLDNNITLSIEYEHTGWITRDSSVFKTIIKELGLQEQEVDEVWQSALAL